MTRIALLVGAALLLGGCYGGSSPSSEPGASATAGPSNTAPSPTSTPVPVVPPTEAPTVEPTLEPDPTPEPPGTYGPCPTLSPFTVRQFVTADPACFGGDDIVIRGWLDTPPALGWEPPSVEPAWIYYPAPDYPTLFNGKPTDPEHVCAEGAPECPWFFLHVDPESGLTLAGRPRWVLVTGHLADPAAETCHWVYPADWTDEFLDDQDAVDQCRTQFVVVSFRNAP